VHIFYTPDIENHAQQYVLSEEESKHSIRVLRLLVGAEITLIDGRGGAYIAEIEDPHPKRTQVKIRSFTQRPTNRPYNLHMAVAPTKSIERYEWFLEKATEIGVDEITPIICEHSERKDIKAARLNKIVIAAMKQSQQYFIPKLNEPIKFQEFLDQKRGEKKFIAHCAENEKQFLSSCLSVQENSIILIGPEGDFSTSEISQAISTGFIPISLGDTRLRTETAAIVACIEVNLINR